MKLFGKSVQKRAGKGAVLLIAGLFLSSAGIRLGVGAGQAVATENSIMTDEGMPAQQSGAGTETDSSIDFAPMLAAFQEREAQIIEQEHQINMRMKALQVADEQIEKRMAMLQAAEESLRATLALADSAAEDDLSRLTTVYENMKPKDAAILFEEMEPAFAAGFLGRMRPDAAAGVMAGLTPKAAYSISVILAGRNASVPKN